MATKTKEKQKATRRDNGDGHIRKRSDGRWEAIIQIGVKEDGKPEKKHLYAKTEREVKKKLKEYKIKLARGYEEVSKQNLSSYIDNYLKTYKLNSIKPSSYDRLENTFIHHVKPTIGYIQVGNVNVHDIQKLINEKSTELSYSSVKKIYELLNQCFKHALVVGDIMKNPILGVVMPMRNQMVVKTKVIEEYSDEDIEKITNVIKSTFNNKRQLYRYSPVYIFILNTGIREGEALALPWDNIDFNMKKVLIDSSLSYVKDRLPNGEMNGRKIVIDDTKTSSGYRTIPLNQTAINALEEIKRRNKQQHITSDFVISDLNGNHLTPRNFYRTWESITRRAGVENKGVHALRHTFGSRALRAGVDIKVVSELLGHSNINITYDTYIHIIKEQKIKAVKELELI